MLKDIKLGFSTGLKHWQIALLVYFFQLCLALTVGLQIFSIFESSIGNSLEINKLLQHYDYTVITDFLKVHGASITPLIGQLRWLIIVYLLFAIFIDAGLLTAASKGKEATLSTFWQGGASYFFPFLKIAAVFFALFAGWTALIFMPTLTYMQPALDYFPNEKYVIYGTFFCLFVYFMGLCLLFLWSVSSRFWKISHNDSVLSSLKNGWIIFGKNKKAMWRLWAFFCALQVVLIAVYGLLESYIGMTTPFLILLVALIQQLFAFARVMLRQILYIGISSVIVP